MTFIFEVRGIELVPYPVKVLRPASVTGTQYDSKQKPDLSNDYCQHQERREVGEMDDHPIYDENQQHARVEMNDVYCSEKTYKIQERMQESAVQDP